MPTESQLRDTALRQRVHQLIENGRLPVMPPAQINAGHGSGCLCAACDQQITSTQVEYEVEDESTHRRLRFHMGCHVVWQLECA
jgi:hypothetical protein